MMILAMDLGKFNTVCCFYDTQSRKYRFETIATKRSHLDHLLDKNHTDLVVMEAWKGKRGRTSIMKQHRIARISLRH